MDTSGSKYCFYVCIEVRQKFCNILVTSGTIWQILMLLLWLWRLWSMLDCEMPSSPDTLWVCLDGLVHGLGICSFRFTWPCLIDKVLVTWAKLFVLSGYCTVINFSHNRCFWLLLQHYYPVWRIQSRIRWHCTYICMAFKSHTKESQPSQLGL